MAVEPDYLTAAQAARVLGITPRRFRELRAEHPLACYRFGGDHAHPRFRRADLDLWADRFRHEPAALPLPTASKPTPRARGRRSWREIVGRALDNAPPRDTLGDGVLRPNSERSA
ncbi:MAG TPA: helix-turn-helix domain-containing protein [Planctomycetota bacterium]|nr:helix-turn-helix domain-containing protein [Planctomycetota bacterium]HRR82613.1 helix-turn-helix domain-containing protein [Planctomycetota bacterium]HRT94793.1 helix-turn-helix domain-containing protein [Planctomycetota bacterium]